MQVTTSPQKTLLE